MLSAVKGKGMSCERSNICFFKTAFLSELWSKLIAFAAPEDDSSHLADA